MKLFITVFITIAILVTYFLFLYTKTIETERIRYYQKAKTEIFDSLKIGLYLYRYYIDECYDPDADLSIRPIDSSKVVRYAVYDRLFECHVLYCPFYHDYDDTAGAKFMNFYSEEDCFNFGLRTRDSAITLMDSIVKDWYKHFHH